MFRISNFGFNGMGKKTAVFIGKLLLLFLLLELALRLGEGPLLRGYEFKHKSDRVTWWAGDLELMLRMHKLSSPKAPGEFRIVLVGNSAIYGGGLPYEKTIGGYLGEMLGKTPLKKGHPKVYNIGGGGAFAVDDFVVLKEALRYRPDLVVWGLTLRDFALREITEGRFTHENHRYVMATQPWLAKHGYEELFFLYLASWLKTTKPPEKAEQSFSDFLSRHWYLYRYKEVLREIIIDKLLYFFPEKVAQEMINNYHRDFRVFTFAPPPFARLEKNFTFPNPSIRFLGAVKELLNAQQVELMVFNQPTIFQDQTYPGDTLKQFFQFMDRQTPILSVPYINLADSLEASRENFYDFIHLTPQGNRRTAELLAQKIRERY